MEALSKELSCPVCLDLFTPPVIELLCGHNYCKKCIKQTLIAQNCTQASEQFLCPMCRKAFSLGAKGINGMKRNIFAENVLEQVKDEIESAEAKEKVLKTQMCPEHDEEMTLMCLDDNKLICSACKLFGDHSTHSVAKLPNVYEKRKKGFVQQMKSLQDKRKANIQKIESLVEQKVDLLSTTKDIVVLLQKLGDSLIEEIQMKVSHVILKVQTECSIRCKSLQDGMDELSAPPRIHDEMKKHLETSKSPTEFLKEERRLYNKSVEALKTINLSDHYREYISLGQYVEDLMSGIDVKKIATVRRSSFARKMSQELKAWTSGRTNFDSTAYRSLDVMLTKTASLVSENNCEEDNSLSWEIQSSSDEEDATVELDKE